jgi:hypothetical protein
MAFGPILCVGECYYQSELKLSEEIRRLKLLPVPVPFTKRAFFWAACAPAHIRTFIVKFCCAAIYNLKLQSDYSDCAARDIFFCTALHACIQ